MGVSVNGGHVPGRKKDRLSGHACAWPWSPRACRRLDAAGITAAVLGAAACTSADPGSPPASAARTPAAVSSAAPSVTVPASGAASSLEQQYEQVVARVLPSVVQISTSEGSGSGVVYDTKGDIVTNAHVVGSATTLQVGPASGGRPLAATVVGVFAPDDLAVIRVQAGAQILHPASFGRSAAVRVGEIVLAMGNPLGLTGTVTDGIVSATERTVSVTAFAKYGRRRGSGADTRRGVPGGGFMSGAAQAHLPGGPYEEPEPASKDRDRDWAPGLTSASGLVSVPALGRET